MEGLAKLPGNVREWKHRRRFWPRQRPLGSGDTGGTDDTDQTEQLQCEFHGGLIGSNREGFSQMPSLP